MRSSSRVVLIVIAATLSDTGLALARPAPGEAEAVKRLRELGGTVVLAGNHAVEASAPMPPDLLKAPAGPRFDEAMACVATFKELRRFGAYSITESGMKRLTACKELEHLDLIGEYVEKSALAHLREFPRLRRLNLILSKIGDDDLRYLEASDRLEKLSLGGCKIRGPGLVHIKHLQRLDYLFLNTNPINDQGLSEAGGLPPNLVTLNLSETSITAESMKWLEPLRHLESLALDSTLIGDESTRVLAALPRLARLKMENTLLTDKGLDTLKASLRLEALNAKSTEVTDDGVKSFERSRPNRVAHR